MEDRDNAQFLDETARKTVVVFAVIAANTPKCGHASEVSEITGIPEVECQTILISLAYDGWIRETEEGFQTVRQKAEKLDRHAHTILDEYLKDWYCYDGSPMPRIRLPDGSWRPI